MFLWFYSSATVIRLCTVLTVAVYLAGFWYAIGGQHIYTAAMQHRKEMEKKNHPLPTWTKEFEAFKLNVVHCYPSEERSQGFIKCRPQAALCQPPMNACSSIWSILGSTEVARC